MRAAALGGLLVFSVFVPSLTGAADGAAVTVESATSVIREESRLIGRPVPDIPLMLADGRRVKLSDLWRERPLVVTLYYTGCPGICTPFLEWVRDAVHGVGGLGSDYQVLALTFDDAETVTDLRAQAQVLGLTDAPNWSFAVASRQDVAQLAARLDYKYQLDPRTQEFEHDSLLVGIDGGRVVRAVLGTANGAKRLRELIWEMRGRFVSVYKVPGRTLLSCLSFDPQSGKVRLDWGLPLLVLPAICAISLALLTFTGMNRRPVQVMIRGKHHVHRRHDEQREQRADRNSREDHQAQVES